MAACSIAKTLDLLYSTGAQVVDKKFLFISSVLTLNVCFETTVMNLLCQLFSKLQKNHYKFDN